ncbi:unnamed protein product [Effrenium voratum]|uniref:GST C-terminal domain-containing protein n=1 Tax=Effrenium voratum TaxID=2562239 RepID=A0AA36J4N6_9DINO|nr:unnamed protein product [Effrenium voratum]
MGYPYLDRPDDELAFPMPGGFDRGKNRMQQWILPDSPHPPASGRYHLFLNYSCGWSGQALLARSLKGLTEVVSISHTLQCPVRPNGWPILQPDPTGNGFTTACEVYNSNNPDYGTKQLTVPILFDKESKKVVSNDPAHILLMLNEAFGDMGNSLDLYPVDKRQEIEEVNSILYPGLNDGVYRCGFAQEDEHYLLAFEGLQAALRFMDQALLRQKFLCGDQLTLADVRAFPHLIRFDLIYRQLMLRASPPPPSLPDAVREYVRRLYEYPEVKVTCDPHLALVGYFAQLGRLRGLTKTIAEDDEMYEQYKYEWLPSKRELELKRKSEGLPEKAEHHLPACTDAMKKQIEDQLAEKAPPSIKPCFPLCGGPVATTEKCMCMVPADQQEQEAEKSYQLKYGTGRTYRRHLEKDFGMAAACSKDASPSGSTWTGLCDKTKARLEVLEGTDNQRVAASRISDALLGACREAKKDLKALEDLAESGLQVISAETWDELVDQVNYGQCADTFTTLESIPERPPAPVYDNLPLMEDSDELRPLLAKLRKLVGLQSVKEAMGQLFGLVKLSNWRDLLGMASLGGQSFHMRFLGNPGTGKTVVARIVGEMMVKMQVVAMPPEQQQKLEEEARNQSKAEGRPKGAPLDIPLVFREAARVDLVAQYLGQTAPKVEKAVSNALGGVLFIDEAYALVRNGKDAFGQEAVDTLIKEMEDKRKNVIVILAGYESEMDSFFDSNPGFKSRVPFTFRFEDYSCTELGQIGNLVLGSQGLTMPAAVTPRLEDLIAFTSGCCNNIADADCHPSRDNGNGRTVRNVIEALQRAMATRVVKSRSTSPELQAMTLEDVTTVAEEQASARLQGPCGTEGLMTTLGEAAKEKAREPSG